MTHPKQSDSMTFHVAVQVTSDMEGRPIGVQVDDKRMDMAAWIASVERRLAELGA